MAKFFGGARIHFSRQFFNDFIVSYLPQPVQ